MRPLAFVLSTSLFAIDAGSAVKCGPHDLFEFAERELASEVAKGFVDCLTRASFAEFVQSPKIFAVSDGPRRIMYNCFDAEDNTYFVPPTAEFVVSKRELPGETGFNIMSSSLSAICWNVWAHPNIEGEVALIEGRIKVLQVSRSTTSSARISARCGWVSEIYDKRYLAHLKEKC